MNQSDVLKWIEKQIGVASEVIIQLGFRSQLMPMSPAEMARFSLLENDITMLQELERIVINWFSLSLSKT